MNRDAHLGEIAEQGYTIVADAIEPDLVDALDDDLRPARARARAWCRPTNDFEGDHTVRIYNLLVHGDRLPADPGAPGRAARRRGRARPRLPHLVAVVDRHRPGRDGPADPRRRPAHPAPQAASADRLQHACGRSPTSPRRTAPPASSRARHLLRTTPPTTAGPTTRSPPRWPRAACSSGTAASGTAAVPTPPTNAASASP